MVKVTYGNNLQRENDIVDETMTIKDFMEDHDMNYTAGTTNLDGATLKAGDINKTFADFGVSERCCLFSVVKADNA